MDPVARIRLAPLNHLIGGEPWARALLQAFAGRNVRVLAPPAPALSARVTPGGEFEPAAAAEPIAVTIELSPGALIDLVGDRPRAVERMRFAGDAEFAEALRTIALHLRWDPEQALSQWVGDIAARRLVAAGSAASTWPRAAGRRFAENIAEYLAHETQALVDRAELERHRASLETVGGTVDALASRVSALEQRLRRG